MRSSISSLPPSLTVATWASGSRISTSASVTMSRARTSPGLGRAQHQRLRLIRVHLERNLLQVQDDVGRVLDHALNRRELVEHAFDLDGGHRGALDRRQQHAPQRVPDRRPEPALERLRVEPAEPIGQGLTLEFEPLGTLKTFPQHDVDLSFRHRGPAPGARLPQTCGTHRRPPAAGLKSCGPAMGTIATDTDSTSHLLETDAPRRAKCRPCSAYFEYSSTMSCSCAGRLICSRVGSDDTRPDSAAGSRRSQSGMPRPFTSSIAC